MLPCYITNCLFLVIFIALHYLCVPLLVLQTEMAVSDQGNLGNLKGFVAPNVKACLVWVALEQIKVVERLFCHIITKCTLFLKFLVALPCFLPLTAHCFLLYHFKPWIQLELLTLQPKIEEQLRYSKHFGLFTDKDVPKCSTLTSHVPLEKSVKMVMRATETKQWWNTDINKEINHQCLPYFFCY